MEYIKNIKKEELRDSNCCRLCGIKSRIDNPFSISFIPIFNGINELSSKRNEPLDVLINRWLPLNVYSTDKYYPRLICSNCYYALDDTISFLDRILQGQKILTKIINQNESIHSLIYSSDNPLKNAPKRRGRPKRDPNQPKAKQEVSSNDNVLTNRPQRSSKPPLRYGVDYVLNSNNTQLNSNTTIEEENDAKLNDSIQNSDQTQFRIVRPSEESLVKLDIILDGDEENEDVQSVPNTRQETVTSTINNYDTLNFDPVPESENEVVIQSEEVGLANQVSADINQNGHEDKDYKEFDDEDFFSEKSKTKKVKIRRKKKRSSLTGKNPPLKCLEAGCELVYSSHASLRYHRQRVHQKNSIYNCPNCDRTFTHKHLLRQHQSSHSDMKPFKCDHCNATFKTSQNLRVHLNSVHKGKHYKCTTCGKTFGLKSTLKSHSFIHTGDKPYICQYCGKSFAQIGNLRSHTRIHTGERPFKCDYPMCERTFITSSQMKTHKLTHTGKKQFLCSTCGKEFSSRSTFKYHQYRHQSGIEKPFKCIHCTKAFYTPWLYRSHLRLHTNEKPYSCKICGELFADRSNLSKHRKNHNKNIIPSNPNVDEVILNEGEASDEPLNVLASLLETGNGEPTAVIEISDENGEATGTFDLSNVGTMLTILNPESILEGGSGEDHGQIILVAATPEDILKLAFEGDNGEYLHLISNGENERLGNDAIQDVVSVNSTSNPTQPALRTTTIGGDEETSTTSNVKYVQVQLDEDSIFELEEGSNATVLLQDK